MATPTIRSAYTNLYTTLQDISTANSYATDVANVRQYVLDWEDASQEGLPWVGFAPGPTSAVEHHHGGHIRVTQLVFVACHTQANTQTEAYDLLEALIDDTLGAVLADPSRGGYAINTLYRRHQTDEGSPDHMDHRGGTATAVIEFDIVYCRTTGVTT